jgi:hypothetical protein
MGASAEDGITTTGFSFKKQAGVLKLVIFILLFFSLLVIGRRHPDGL